jgi:hypothetical protein
VNDAFRTQFASLADHIAGMKVACAGLKLNEAGSDAAALERRNFRMHLAHARARLAEIERNFQQHP